MSIGAKLLNAGMKLSGIKKKYALPEAQFLETVRKMNRRREFFLPKNRWRLPLPESAGGGNRGQNRESVAGRSQGTDRPGDFQRVQRRG